MKTLTLSLASHIIVVCGVSLTLSTTALRSQPPHQLQVRGWPGATRPRTWFHLTQHFKLWVNYISLSAQVGILCVFLTGQLSVCKVRPDQIMNRNSRSSLIPFLHISLFSTINLMQMLDTSKLGAGLRRLGDRKQ